MSVGIRIVVATLALMKDGVVRHSLVIASSVGVLAIVAGGILQLPASCPGVVPCVFR